MTVLDTDIFSDFRYGRNDVVARVQSVPADELALTVVTVVESLKGWLAEIVRATNFTNPSSLTVAYAQLQLSLAAVSDYEVLPYTHSAHTIFLAWRTAKVRIGTQDLRIAAICVAHDATLVSRNKRDFDNVPELKLSVWN